MMCPGHRAEFPPTLLDCSAFQPSAIAPRLGRTRRAPVSVTGRNRATPQRSGDEMPEKKQGGMGGKLTAPKKATKKKAAKKK